MIRKSFWFFAWLATAIVQEYCRVAFHRIPQPVIRLHDKLEAKTR